MQGGITRPFGAAGIAGVLHRFAACRTQLIDDLRFEPFDDRFLIWRRGRDSNPRWGLTHTPLAGERLQPLGHLSGKRILLF